MRNGIEPLRRCSSKRVWPAVRSLVVAQSMDFRRRYWRGKFWPLVDEERNVSELVECFMNLARGEKR